MFSNNLNLFTVIGITVILVILIAISRGYESDSVENFVAWNNLTVRDTRPFGLLRNDEIVKQAFKDIVKQDEGKLPNRNFEGWKQSEWFEEQVKGIIHYVLRRINLTTGRHFMPLDMQSVQKTSTFDPISGRGVNRFVVNIFIQDKQPKQVHANASNISFTVLQRDDLVKIESLHTITDHFYEKPLVDGPNVFDNYYKIENPFHLTAPWKTSGDEVIMDPESTERLLDLWHDDLKRPKYRCFSEDGVFRSKESQDMFEEQGNRWKTQTACQESRGVWDKPVDKDGECPFYRANKHFPNRLGGVKLHDQRCEMPINTKTIGYRNVSTDPKHQPYCYNCNIGADGMAGSWGPCCSDQRDPSLYPNLGGNPDYAFPGDEFERAQYWRELAERGLHWSKHPTKIRDVTNQTQKNPVFNKIVGPGPEKITLN